MAFWSDYRVGDGLEPKRKFTFLLEIQGSNGAIENYLIKKVKKPGYEVSETDHKFLNHVFKYPGKVKWKDVTFTLIDVINPNSSNRFLQLLDKSGYKWPNVPPQADNTSAMTISKNKSVEALGIPRIYQLDADGNTVEIWKLHGAWIKDVDNGELDYSSEDMLDITVTLVYDYATCEFKGSTTGELPTPNA